MKDVISTIYCKEGGYIVMVVSGSTINDIRRWVGQYPEIEAVLNFNGRERRLQVKRKAVFRKVEPKQPKEDQIIIAPATAVGRFHPPPPHLQ